MQPVVQEQPVVKTTAPQKAATLPAASLFAGVLALPRSTLPPRQATKVQQQDQQDQQEPHQQPPQLQLQPQPQLQKIITIMRLANHHPLYLRRVSGSICTQAKHRAGTPQSLQATGMQIALQSTIPRR